MFASYHPWVPFTPDTVLQPDPLLRALPIPAATTAGLRPRIVRLRIRGTRGTSERALFEVSHLLADSLGVVHATGLPLRSYR